MANTLAYYDTATISAVKCFIVQAPGCNLRQKKVLYDWVKALLPLIKCECLKFEVFENVLSGIQSHCFNCLLGKQLEFVRQGDI